MLTFDEHSIAVFRVQERQNAEVYCSEWVDT